MERITLLILQGGGIVVYKVPVYDDSPTVIGRVEYNEILDVWNGSNYQKGGTGYHLGLAMLKDGRPVLIHGTDWQGKRDYADVVTMAEAAQAVFETADPETILAEPRFLKLREWITQNMVEEES